MSDWENRKCFNFSKYSNINKTKITTTATTTTDTSAHFHIYDAL